MLMAGTSLQAQTTPAEAVAQRIAQKMKDSLSLTESQRVQLYQLNLQLHERKQAARQQYGGSSVLASEVQKMENGRDSLYKAVLTEVQFQQYRQKKRNLISNN